MRFTITALLTVDDTAYDLSDETEAAWFHALLHSEDLTVHSDELGDAIGTLRVMRAEGERRKEIDK